MRTTEQKQPTRSETESGTNATRERRATHNNPMLQHGDRKRERMAVAALEDDEAPSEGLPLIQMKRNNETATEQSARSDSPTDTSARPNDRGQKRARKACDQRQTLEDSVTRFFAVERV